MAGIGFIGAGTIIVTRQQRVKGLTTAAGLWACAILGLAIGAGFFESAVVFACLILLAELLFVKLEYKLLRKSREHILYIEYMGADCLEGILNYFRCEKIRVNSMELTRLQSDECRSANVIFCVQPSRKMNEEALRKQVCGIAGVLSVEEL